jgi:hypothetical protein
MATTTNFGWQTPDDTDLVKDGAAAIRTLGQSIDTSLMDLEGGTTGQILAKNSGTDMDFIWITNDVGDITAVTAGTGISGGGTSGAVTITNSMATEIDAKGDLIGGTGADTFARLAVGANGTVLTADSTETTGLKWATVGSGLTLVKSQTIGSAVSSVTVTDAFSATYTNYRIVISADSQSADATLKLTLGATTANYYAVGFYQAFGTGTVNGFALSNDAYMYGPYGGTNGTSGVIEILKPQLAARTSFTTYAASPTTAGGAAVWNGFLNNATQYTAFTLTPDAGTITGGTINVYGYQKS